MTTTEAASNDTQDAVATTSAPTSTPAAAAADSVAAAGAAQLQLEFSASCWLKVTSADGKYALISSTVFVNEPQAAQTGAGS